MLRLLVGLVLAVALSAPAAAQTPAVSCGYVEGISTPFPASPHISLLSAAGERIGQAPAGPQPWPARGSYVCVAFIPGSPGTFLSYVTPSMPGYLPATSTAADPVSVRPIALLALLPAAVLWILIVAKKRRLDEARRLDIAVRRARPVTRPS